MKKEVEEQVVDVINWEDKYVRLYADMDNLKKRHQREKEELSKNIKARMIDSILDMDNDLSIAMKTLKNVPDGLNLIVNKVVSFLKSQGIEEIQTEVYDSDLHEVVSIIDGDDKILDVVSKGYKIGNDIIRYPKIILSKNVAV